MFARSTEMGNTRASECGMSSMYGSHAFFLPMINDKPGAYVELLLMVSFKRMIRFTSLCVSIVFALGIAACSKEDEQNDPNKDDVIQVVDPSTPVNDPKNTVTVNLLVGQTSKEGVYLSDFKIYINNASNLVGSYLGVGTVGIVDIGQVAGLGNIASILDDGYKSDVAIIVGHGYLIKAHHQKQYEETTYARLYVDSEIISTTGGIMGYRVKYQCPMITPILLDNKLAQIDAAGNMENGINLLSGTMISVSSKPEWIKSVTIDGSKVNIEAYTNMSTQPRSGKILLSNSEGDNEISVTQSGGEKDFFAGGDGSAENPFLVSTPEQFNNIRLAISLVPYACHFKQTGDIDMSAYISSKSAGWKPIESFTGKYDGNFNIISGIWVNLPSDDCIGLFGTADNATFERIILRIGEKGITGHDYVAGICGKSSGQTTIFQCSVEGNVVGGDGYCVSGITNNGDNTNLRIEQCRIIGNINNSDYHYVYGIAPYGSIKDCYFDGTVRSIVTRNHYGFEYIEYHNDSGIALCNSSAQNSYAVGEYGKLSKVSKYCYGSNSQSDEELKKKSTYIDWDFENVWSIEEGKDYPKLRCFENIH